MKKTLLVLLTTYFLSSIAYLRTDGFSPSLIQGPLLSGTSLPITPEISQILKQRFRYLTKGRQAFVFESEDGKYVLKFFNQKYLKMPWYGFLVKKKEEKKRAARRRYYENSYRIAHQEFGEEILYLHLNPSEPISSIRLIDQASSEYEVDGAQIPFVLQRKGIPLNKALRQVWEKEGMEGLSKEIDRFLEAVSLRISKEIADADWNVMDNWGIVDGHIFHLDPGRLYYEEMKDPKRVEEEWHRATRHFYKWLKKNYPPGAVYFQSTLEKKKGVCVNNRTL